MLKTLNFKEIETKGDIRYRAERNLARMESEPYYPDNVFKDKSYDWPGDFEVRTLLAMISDCKVLKRKSENFEEIMERLDLHLNEDGYFGKVCGEVMDEQLLAGNSWFLRALCEKYELDGDKKCLELITKITERLLVKLAPFYEKYPTDMSVRSEAGEAIGSLIQKEVNGWILSTDTACAFIALDGITHVYKLFLRPELKEVIEKGIEVFMGIDKVGIMCQTHSTMSTTRAVLRYYETTGEKKYLEMAMELFELYKKYGMTENYANYNWFNRPLWTEGCCVVDSMICAMDLFRFTEKPEYVKYVNRIYQNAFKFSQRSNGGMGCDMCATLEKPYLYGGEGIFEAFWCCSMRCGEGIYKLSEFQYLEKEGKIYIPLAGEGSAQTEGVKISQKSGGKQGKIILETQTNRAFELSVYVGDCKQVKLNGKIIDAIEGFISFQAEGKALFEINADYEVKTTLKEGKREYFVGDNMLCELTEGKYASANVYEADGKKLIPIPDMIRAEKEEEEKIKVKVVF